MRVRIVCYEDLGSWILSKFAIRMNECLLNMNIDSDIAKHPDPLADINHHIIYYQYDCKITNIDTLMITHIDNRTKLKKLKKQLESASIGICMSKESVDNLAAMGIPRVKLAYVNPAHDGVISPRPKVVGIACRVQRDGRKRENFISRLAYDIDPKLFSFKIMGDGWDKQVEELRKNQFSVEYTNYFDYKKYLEFIPSLDYYLYMGQDEGQMGFVDALAAGVETIVTPQGYHLDAKDGIAYSFNTYNELLNVFILLQKKRLKLIKSVEEWTWKNYTNKHLEIWKYLLAKDKQIPKITSCGNYCDGIYSVDISANTVKISIYSIVHEFVLAFNDLKHNVNIFTNMIGEIGFSPTIKRVVLKAYRKISRFRMAKLND